MRKYTDDEINFLKENMYKLNYAELAEKLGRSIFGVRYKVISLKDSGANMSYTEEENQFIIDNQDKLSISEIAEKLNRTETAIYLQITKIVPDRERERYALSDAEKDFIIKNIDSMSLTEIAFKLNRTVSTINHFKRTKNLVSKKEKLEERNKFLKKHSKDYTSAELAEKFNCDTSTIYTTCRRLGVSCKATQNVFTEKEIEFLKTHGIQYELKELSEILKKEKSAIIHYCNRHGIKYAKFADRMNELTRDIDDE